MDHNILIISASPRRGGNSDTLAEEFLRGAQEAGSHAEKICLYDKTVGFCQGCLACQKTHRCRIHDHADEIVQKMLSAEVIVFATPIYYYEMCGQMKTLLDRTNPLYGTDYSFRDIYLLAAAADGDRNAIEGAEKGLQGWISCFPKARLVKTIFGGDADAVGTIKGHPALQEAYEMGRAVFQERM